MNDWKALLLQQVVFGLVSTCLYSLLAAAYTIIFGLFRVVFFALGELAMLGAFAAAAILTATTGMGPAGLGVAGLGALAAGGTVAVASERLLLRPLRGASRLQQLVVSLGLSLVLQYTVFLAVGSGNRTVPVPLPDEPVISSPLVFSWIQVCIVVVVPLTLFCLDWAIRKTRWGKAMRAVAESPETAGLYGIRFGRVATTAFLVAGLLCGLAGLLMGMYRGVAKFDMGFVPGIKGFTAAVLGGMGNVRGAPLGALVLAMTESLWAGYAPNEYKDVVAFALLVGMLLFRPSGLLAERGSREGSRGHG